MLATWTILLKVLTGWALKLATAEFAEWALLWCARKLVASTETKADDEWFKKIEELIKEGKK